MFRKVEVVVFRSATLTSLPETTIAALPTGTVSMSEKVVRYGSTPAHPSARGALRPLARSRALPHRL